MSVVEMWKKLWEYKPTYNPNYNIYLGEVSYILLHTELKWDAHRVWEICNKRWIYVPKRGRCPIEISLWKKVGLCKVRIDRNSPHNGYKYHSYYGTKLISKSNNILHAVKELIKYNNESTL